MQLKRLTKTAREEMERTELRNKLNAADNEVMEAYKKISQVRQKCQFFFKCDAMLVTIFVHENWLKTRHRLPHSLPQTHIRSVVLKKVRFSDEAQHSYFFRDLETTTLQTIMNAKLSKQRFRHC